MTYPMILATIIVAANVLLTGAIFYVRWLSNRKLFDTSVKPKPVKTNRRFFRMFNGFYDVLDSVPVLRRSGTANEFDLLKAMCFVSVPYLIFNLIIYRPEPFIALLAIGIFHTLINAVLLAHPLTKRLTSRR